MGRVITLGRLDDADLAVAYARAAVVVVPSLSDGFGRPPSKRWGSGRPSCTPTRPPSIEVCSDAGIIVPRLERRRVPASLADAIQGVLDDPSLATQLSVRGRRRAGAFSWRDSAEKSLAVARRPVGFVPARACGVVPL